MIPDTTIVFQITSPFRLLSTANAFALGAALIALSSSIILTNALTSTPTVSHRHRVLFAFSVAALSFYGIRSSVALQQIFSILSLAIVVLFPVVVGYVGFRALVLQGVYEQ